MSKDINLKLNDKDLSEIKKYIRLEVKKELKSEKDIKRKRFMSKVNKAKSLVGLGLIIAIVAICIKQPTIVTDVFEQVFKLVEIVSKIFCDKINGSVMSNK